MVVRGAKEGPNDGFKHLVPLLSGIQSTVQHFFSQECGRKRAQPTPPLPSLDSLHTGPTFTRDCPNIIATGPITKAPVS